MVPDLTIERVETFAVTEGVGLGVEVDGAALEQMGGT